MPRYKIIDLAFLTSLALLVIASMVLDVHWTWYVVVTVIYLGITMGGAFVLSLQYFVRVRWRGTTMDAIAITFDDGPVSGNTEGILEILEAHHVPAAFFCIGSRIKGNEQLLRQIDRGGHLVGNHSYFHGKTFDLMSAKRVAEELRKTDLSVYEALGKRPKFFRPPYGVTNPMIASAVEQDHYTVVGWSVRSFDTITKDPARLLKRITRNLRGGDVVLFHDHCDSTRQVLSEFITHVHQKGLRIIRLDALLNEQPYR
jgi:peptidoglycan-N-acetylglucosamine deacetylase